VVYLFCLHCMRTQDRLCMRSLAAKFFSKAQMEHVTLIGLDSGPRLLQTVRIVSLTDPRTNYAKLYRPKDLARITARPDSTATQR
jgi:hypothetical protein